MVSFNTAVGFVFTVGKCAGFVSTSGTNARRLLTLTSNVLMISLVLVQLWIDVADSKWKTVDFSRAVRRTINKTTFALNMAVHVFWQIRRPKAMKTCLKKLGAISVVLGDKHHTCFNIFILSFSLFSFSAVPAYFNYFNRFTLYDAVFGWTLPVLGNIVLTTQCFTLLETIRSNFLRLNRITPDARDLEACARIHAQLCAVAKDVNQMCHVTLVMSFFDLLAILITRWFQLFESLTTGEPYEGFLNTAPWFFLAKAIQMWSVCLVSYELHYESYTFTDVLCLAVRVQRYPKSYDRNLVLYMAMRPFAKISAYHLFHTDTGILATILGTTMTYFIVLVQLN